MSRYKPKAIPLTTRVAGEEVEGCEQTLAAFPLAPGVTYGLTTVLAHDWRAWGADPRFEYCKNCGATRKLAEAAPEPPA